MADYTWQRHLIAHGVYANWVDRGRLRPTHRQWSTYLRDVADQAQAEIVTGEVTGLEVDGEQWRLSLEPGQAIWADGVVFTGPGPHRSAWPASRSSTRGCSTGAATGWPSPRSQPRWPRACA